ncbi:hypothetical protein C8R43DRAFT_950853 [Mycena crocata]|nr:hypothetical protein C8R43DRAFT_950853 [Mycena crocata]
MACLLFVIANTALFARVSKLGKSYGLAKLSSLSAAAFATPQGPLAMADSYWANTAGLIQYSFPAGKSGLPKDVFLMTVPVVPSTSIRSGGTGQMEPSDGQVIDWLHDKPGVGVMKLHRECASRDPPWIISVKRLRALRRDHDANTALVLACLNQPNKRDEVHVGVTHIPNLQDVSALGRIGDLLSCPDPWIVGRLYESNKNTITWYYEVYAGNAGEKNSLGPVVLVKNGPADAVLDYSLNRQDVVKLLWYYKISGEDPGTVAAARAFERMLLL